MTDVFFRGLFDTDMARVIGIGDFLCCIGSSLLLGAILAGCYRYRSRYTGSFLTTLIFLPAVVCVVVMMVNGSIGAGIAVAGAFSLVRFRSIPGSAKEITMLFLAMAAGLITGMGYLGFALVFTLIMGGLNMMCSRLRLGAGKDTARFKTLRITIPEDLDYPGVFEPVLQEYAQEWELVRVKTTNMGSLFRLTYRLTMHEGGREKEMIDALRCRNGNLEITLSQQERTATEL